jgi:tetratricopeptide (TPR) repeat protein
LLSYFRETLSYKEALFHGESILSSISVKKRDEKFAAFLFQLGCIYHDTGEEKKAVECYKQALSIDKKVFKDTYPGVTSDLDNLGEAWHALGEHEKAIEYYELALSINKKAFEDTHTDAGIRLNNLGAAWHALGDAKRAAEHFEQVYDIFLEFYGDEHPQSRIVKEWLDSLKDESN